MRPITIHAYSVFGPEEMRAGFRLWLAEREHTDIAAVPLRLVVEYPEWAPEAYRRLYPQANPPYLSAMVYRRWWAAIRARWPQAHDPSDALQHARARGARPGWCERMRRAWRTPTMAESLAYHHQAREAGFAAVEQERERMRADLLAFIAEAEALPEVPG